jgi:ABC-type branched-subunit amino acid transport system permease subunit
MFVPANNGNKNLIFAIIGIVLTTAFAMLAMATENQWLLLALLASAGVVVFIANKTGIAASAEQAFSSHHRLMNGVVLLAFALFLVVFHEEHFVLLILSSVLLYAIVCLGLNIQIGYCGVVNFAGAAFFGIGSYTAAVLVTHTHLPHLLILLIGGVFAAAISGLLLLPVLRTRGHYAALVTIAFGILFRTFLEVNETLGGPQGLKVGGMKIFGWSLRENIELGDITISFYANYAICALILAALAFTITKRLERSWIGLSFDAVRIDETAAATFGINIRRWKITAFMIGNGFAGVAGAFFAMMTAFVAPTNFTFGDSLILISIVVMGGIGNPWGILPAATVVLLLPEKLQAIQEYRFLLYALAVIVILLFRPDGLFPRRLRNYLPGWSGK